LQPLPHRLGCGVQRLSGDVVPTAVLLGRHNCSIARAKQEACRVQRLPRKSRGRHTVVNAMRGEDAPARELRRRRNSCCKWLPLLCVLWEQTPAEEERTTEQVRARPAMEHDAPANSGALAEPEEERPLRVRVEESRGSLQPVYHLSCAALHRAGQRHRLRRGRVALEPREAAIR
jgi:hypothetical protein